MGFFKSILDTADGLLHGVENAGQDIWNGVEQVPSAAAYTVQHPLGALENVGGAADWLLNEPLSLSKSGLGWTGYGAAYLNHELGGLVGQDWLLPDQTSWQEYQDAVNNGGGRGFWEKMVSNDPMPVRAGLDILADPLTWAGGVGEVGRAVKISKDAPELYKMVLGGGLEKAAGVLNKPNVYTDKLLQLGGKTVGLTADKIGLYRRAAEGSSGLLPFIYNTRPVQAVEKLTLDPAVTGLRKAFELSGTQKLQNFVKANLNAYRDAKGALLGAMDPMRAGQALATQEAVDKGIERGIGRVRNRPVAFTGGDVSDLHIDSVPDNLHPDMAYYNPDRIGRENVKSAEEWLNSTPESAPTDDLKTTLDEMRTNPKANGQLFTVSPNRSIQVFEDTKKSGYLVPVATVAGDLSTQAKKNTEVIADAVKKYAGVDGVGGDPLVVSVRRNASGKTLSVELNLAVDDIADAHAIAGATNASHITRREDLTDIPAIAGKRTGKSPITDRTSLNNVIQAVETAKAANVPVDEGLSEFGYSARGSRVTSPDVHQQGNKWFVDLDTTTEPLTTGAKKAGISRRSAFVQNGQTVYTRQYQFPTEEAAQAASKYLHQFNSPDEVTAAVMTLNQIKHSGKQLTPETIDNAFQSVIQRQPLLEQVATSEPTDLTITDANRAARTEGAVGGIALPDTMRMEAPIPGGSIPSGTRNLNMMNERTETPSGLTFAQHTPAPEVPSPLDLPEQVEGKVVSPDPVGDLANSLATNPPQTLSAVNDLTQRIAEQKAKIEEAKKNLANINNHRTAQSIDRDAARLSRVSSDLNVVKKKVVNDYQRFGKTSAERFNDAFSEPRITSGGRPIAFSDGHTYYAETPYNHNIDPIPGLSDEVQARVQGEKVKGKTIADWIVSDFRDYQQKHEALAGLSTVFDHTLSRTARIADIKAGKVDDLLAAGGTTKEEAIDLLNKWGKLNVDPIYQDENEAFASLLTDEAAERYGVDLNKRESTLGLLKGVWGEQALATLHYLTSNFLGNITDAAIMTIGNADKYGYQWTQVWKGADPRTIARLAGDDFRGKSRIDMMTNMPSFRQVLDEFGLSELPPSVMESNTASMLGGAQKRSATRRLLERIGGPSLGKPLGNLARPIEFSKAVAYGTDVTMRSAVFTQALWNKWYEGEAQLGAKVAETLSRGGMKDVDKVDLFPTHDPTKLRYYYESLGAASGFAQRASRDVANRVNTIVKDSATDVGKAFVDYQRRNIDDWASKIIPFHFWASRKVVWYGKMAYENPVILANYLRAQDGINRAYNDPGTSARQKGFLALFNGPGGFTLLMNPQSLMGVIRATGLDLNNDGSSNGATGFGQFMNIMKNNGVSLYPWFDAAFNAIGAYGDTFEPDALGIRDKALVGAMINAVAAHLGMSQPDAIYSDMSDAARAKVSKWASLALPDWLSQPVQRNPEGSITQATVDHLIENRIIDDNPDMTNAELVQIMGDPDSPEYQQAFKEAADAGVMTQLLSFISPVSMKLRDSGTDVRAAISSETKKEAQKIGVNPEDLTNVEASPEFMAEYKKQTGQDFTYGTFQNADERRQFVTASQPAKEFMVMDAGYKNIGTPRQQQIYGEYQNIINGNGQYAAIPQDRRNIAAMNYLNSIPGAQGLITQLRQLQTAYRQQNPEYDAYKQWQSRMYQAADKFGGSLAVYRQVAAQRDPDIARYLQDQTKQYRKQGYNGQQLADKLDQSVLTPAYYFLTQKNSYYQSYGTAPQNPGMGDQLNNLIPQDPNNIPNYVQGPLTQPVNQDWTAALNQYQQ